MHAPVEDLSQSRKIKLIIIPHKLAHSVAAAAAALTVLAEMLEDSYTAAALAGVALTEMVVALRELFHTIPEPAVVVVDSMEAVLD
jgi:KaiC/GvpD/RAD55 family RecA-like ATPase